MNLPEFKCCPACGQALLSPTQVLIFNALRQQPGLTYDQLRAAVWSHRKDGGPEARTVLHTLIARMNQRLRPFGLRIRATRTGKPGARAALWNIHSVKVLEAAE